MKFALVFSALIASCSFAESRSVESRIYSGYTAAANQFPHQVALTIPLGNGAAACGGSVISTSWVLTAAHCVNRATQVNMRFGSLNRASGGIVQTSFRFIFHPNFNVFLNNDVAVIYIPVQLTLTPPIQVIRLPARSQRATTFVNIQSTVSGWGENGPNTGVQTFLRWTNVRVISNMECMRAYGPFSVVGHVVCTLGSGRINAGVCGGDSGGPLIINEGGINTQLGIVAFGNHPDRGGCSTTHPSGYMRTSHFLDWINSHTGIPVRS